MMPVRDLEVRDERAPRSLFWCLVAVGTLLVGFLAGLWLGERYFSQPENFIVNAAKLERLRQQREETSKDCRQAVPVNSPEIDGRCAVPLTAEPAEKTVLYEEELDRFSLEVPFSLSWGTDRYRLETVEKRDDVYYFGRPVAENCHWTREHYLEIAKTIDPDKFMEELRLSSETVVAPEEFKAGGLTAYRLVVSGLCPRPQVIVFGARRAYRFGYASPCSQMPEAEAAMTALSELAASLHIKS